jgi:dienelactone hydrolase
MTPPDRRRVTFPGGESTLGGFLYLPEGRGLFSAVLWNHGSEKEPSACDELAAFYTAAGYVFLCPHRRGHGLSPGEYAFGVPPTGTRAEAIGTLIRLHERELTDTLAAVDWLAGQPNVDEGRMAVSGVSHGGIQTILVAEADAGPAAYVPFAPFAMGWEGNPELHERLVQAVRAARAPMFLLQAENDYSLGPSKLLGQELERKGSLNRARVYPPYGESRAAGHGAFALGATDIWGADVCTFLDEALAAGRRHLDSPVC